MGTTSNIGLHEKNGNIRYVYCHWDGYYEHNGVVLYNFYNTKKKVENLINHGSLSYLGTEIGKKHNFNKSYYGCTFYHRDRGEEKDIEVAEVLSALNPYAGIYQQEYNYVFSEQTGAWYVKKLCGDKWKKLKNVLANCEYEDWLVPVSDKNQYQKLVNFYTRYGKSDMKIPNYEEVSYEI